MTVSEYLQNPCRASSLPYWKTERLVIPAQLDILRDDAFVPDRCRGADEPYFKMIHDLRGIGRPTLPARFACVPCSIDGFADHIRACYADVGISPKELRAYREHPVFDPDLWIAVAERESRTIVATGIAELDARIGEGILEWIQVSPAYRRQGLGAYVVCELLRRMQGRAQFATVCGRVHSPSNPFSLYTACGFRDPVIWHVVTRE